MNILPNLKYTKSHEWVEFLSETTVRVGITDFAQSHMGDIVFVNLPSEGGEAAVGATLTDIESVKAVEDIYSPVTGIIARVNGELDGAPEKINESPYEAWIVEIADVTATEALLDAAAYADLCEAEG